MSDEKEYYTATNPPTGRREPGDKDRERLERAVELLTRLEWCVPFRQISSGLTFYNCPFCGEETADGHVDCDLGAFLAEQED